MDYHFKKVQEAGASNEEIQQTISDALSVRDSAKNIIESHGLQHLGIKKDAGEYNSSTKTTRIRELVSIASAFAVNCTTNLEKHIAAAGTVGISDDEVNSVLDLALFIKDEAAHYVGQIVQLKAEKNKLQELLDTLQKTQAQLVQSEKMAALGKLVAGIVHEINTPVGVINSSTHIANRSINNILEIFKRNQNIDEFKKNKKLYASLNALQNNAPVTKLASERITRIINSLKSFTQLDESSFKKCDIHERIESTLTLIEHELDNRIAIAKEYGKIPRIAVYPGELNQVFMNILTNAIHAIKGKGTITIRTYMKDRNVYVEIVDTGIGISAEQQQHLFEPGFTEKESRVKARLGLFTSYNIIKKHCGQIMVDSETGKGSTFTVILPIDAKNMLKVHEKAKPNKPTSRCESPSRCERPRP